MAVKSYFGADGVLRQVELPDSPLSVPHLAGDRSAAAMFNPTNVDVDTLLVDAAEFPNLRPTDGAPPTLSKFPDPLPGNGEGAGVGQKSGATLRDAWNNNPLKDAGTVETVQSGPIGANVVATPALVATDAEFNEAAKAWKNKDDVREAIKAWGGEDPHVNATRDELETAAREAYDNSKLA